MVIASFAIQRQASPVARRDKTWSSAPFLLSRDKQVRWHRETNYGQPHPFSYPETIKSDGTQRQNMVIPALFAMQRQASPMAHKDKLWSSAPCHTLISSGDCYLMIYNL